MSQIRRAWICLLLGGCYLFLIALVLVPQITGQAKPGEFAGNVVTEWNAIAQDAIVTIGAQPIQRSQLWMTLVHVAIYDAVTSINGEYEQFKVTPAHLRPASRDAAAIAAAHGILVRLLPSQQATLDAARERSLAPIRDGAKKDNGIAIGEEVSSRLLEIHDGVIPTVTYTPGAGPGVWQPTPPAFANALLPGFAQITPFALASASQFRPGPPPSLSSSVWTKDYNEVMAFGVATGSLRTPDRRRLGASTPSTPLPSTAVRSDGMRSRTVSTFGRPLGSLRWRIPQSSIPRSRAGTRSSITTSGDR
jgi:hypothetical protein